MGDLIADLAYCRFRLPDLDTAEAFLLEFGLLPARREDDRRYYRTTDPGSYCYVVEHGPQKFLGYAFRASSREHLESFAQHRGVEVEPIDGFAGGWRVRIKDHNGFDVDLVHGMEDAPALPVARQANNTGAQPLLRAGELYRLNKAAITPLKRLAHVVVGTPDVEDSVRWYREVLGLISSDDVFAGPEKMLGSFMRIDAGDAYVDHHAIFVMRSDKVGLHHVSFEAQDIDAVMAEHHRLKTMTGYEQLWGVGRHLLGSQIFDYWSDPFGYTHEHWADSDRLNASTPTNKWAAADGMITQWGEEPPERYRGRVRP